MIFKSIITGVLCLCAEYSFAQYGYTRGEVRAEVDISPRWTATAQGYVGHEFGRAVSSDVSAALGAAFCLYDGVFAYAAAQIESSDVSGGGTAGVYTLREALALRTDRDMVHSITLEQRRLTYSALNNSINCSRLSYTLAKLWTLNEAWTAIGEGAIVLNTKSEITDSSILQRLRFKVGVRRSLCRSLSLYASYAYQCLGQDQTYIADRHNLHTLSLTLEYAHRR